MLRTELEKFLEETFHYTEFEDFCKNGLQVEGKDEIQTIAFGVTLSLPLLEKAIALHADAIIVHHGFFGKEFLDVTGVMKQRLKLLLKHDVSFFGVHLPLDAHSEYGNNAQLFAYLDAEITEPFAVGFIGKNSRHYSLLQMVDIFHQRLHPNTFTPPSIGKSPSSVLMPEQRHGFLYYHHGPEIPETIAIISGTSESRYQNEEAIKKGIDTFICGGISETIAAISYETRTNFLNIGHYWSEEAGPLALQAAIQQQFDVETVFVELENII